MSTLEQAGKANQGEIRYLTPLDIATKNSKKYCMFKRSGIKYVDYKDPDFLLRFINEQGKILPRRLTGTSLKYQRKVSVGYENFSKLLSSFKYVKEQFLYFLLYLKISI